jgi:hypothetical protein
MEDHFRPLVQFQQLIHRQGNQRAPLTFLTRPMDDRMLRLVQFQHLLGPQDSHRSPLTFLPI